MTAWRSLGHRPKGAPVTDRRLQQHPILPVLKRDEVPFSWQGRPLFANEGETIAAALFAQGEQIFGWHAKDGAPQGIFCANGQCAQCLVVANGRPVKACMTAVRPGMGVEPLRGRPRLPARDQVPELHDIERIERPVLIIGGGPAGLSAAAQLGARGIGTLLVDDKDRLGGKLVLQTHRFFGSVEAVYAGTRGIDIAAKLEGEVRAQASVEVWLNSTALAVFSDGWVGVLKDGRRYLLVKPQALLVAAGAREKALSFRGNTLPGVYGAGAFQTLLNRDRIRPAERLFIVGGGNVGLITGYHALQAGIKVVGLAEAQPECGGYTVHRDKLARLGVPIYTAHTIASAEGRGRVEGVTIARVDRTLRPLPGTEKSFRCDAVLMAVGLDRVSEFADKARAFGLTVFSAGDADEIAEASSAMYSGKIRGLELARALGYRVGEVPPDWRRTAEVLTSRPGPTVQPASPRRRTGVFPVFHCFQEIPCNPCTTACPKGLIHIDPDDIRRVPVYLGFSGAASCIGCEKCVRVCPGLAISLVDYRKEPARATVTLPFEFGAEVLAPGDVVTAVDARGGVLGEVEVAHVRSAKAYDRTSLVKLTAPRKIAARIAGFRLQQSDDFVAVAAGRRIQDGAVVCRCERVTVQEVRDLIRAGYRDVNQIKALTRAGMGACGAKTCSELVAQLFRAEGVPAAEVTPGVRRPLFVETPLGAFAGIEDE